MAHLEAPVSSLAPPPPQGQAHSRTSETRADAPAPWRDLTLTSLSPSLEPDSWDKRLRSHRERLGRAGGPLGVGARWTFLRMSLSASAGVAGGSRRSPWKTWQAARRWASGDASGSGGDTGATERRRATWCGLWASCSAPGVLTEGHGAGAGGSGQEAAYSVRNSRLKASAISPVSRVTRPRCRRASLHVKLGGTETGIRTWPGPCHQPSTWAWGRLCDHGFRQVLPPPTSPSGGWKPPRSPPEGGCEHDTLRC